VAGPEGTEFPVPLFGFKADTHDLGNSGFITIKDEGYAAYFFTELDVTLVQTDLTSQDIWVYYGWNLIGNSMDRDAMIELPYGTFAYMLVDGSWVTLSSGQTLPMGHAALVGSFWWWNEVTLTAV